VRAPKVVARRKRWTRYGRRVGRRRAAGGGDGDGAAAGVVVVG